MAFQGVAPVVRTAGPANIGNFKNFIRMEFPAAALLANLGAGYAVGTGDSGRLTSSTAVVANTNYIGGGTPGVPAVSAVAARFGRTAGNWLANDEFFVHCWVENASTALQGGIGQTSLIDIFAKRINGGQLEIDIFNRGAQVSAAFALSIWWIHSSVL